MDDSNPINEEHSFTEFLETIKEPPAVDENGDEVDDTIPELPSTQNCPDDVVCAVCGWRPRPSCKDKHRALQRHMREKHGQRSHNAIKKPLPVVLDEVEKVNVLDEDDEKLYLDKLWLAAQVRPRELGVARPRLEADHRPERRARQRQPV